MKTLNLHEEKISIINWITQLSDSSLIQKLSSLKEKNPPVPQWHTDEVEQRIKNAKPEDYIDFDLAMEDIEKNL